jgi:hypothetical protein
VLEQQEDASADIDTVLVPAMSMVQNYSALRQSREVCLKRQGHFSLFRRLVEDLEVSPSRSVLYKDIDSICPRSAPCGVLHLECMIDTRSTIPRARQLLPKPYKVMKTTVEFGILTLGNLSLLLISHLTSRCKTFVTASCSQRLAVITTCSRSVVSAGFRSYKNHSQSRRHRSLDGQR